jgi:hypothetical protein
VGLLAARAVAVPSLADPLGSPLPPQLHLTAPWPYLLFAPLFSLWDGVSMLSLSRLRGFLLGLLLLYLGWRIIAGIARRRQADEPAGRGRALGREVGALAISAGALLLFVAVGALWHRPMLALAGVPPGEVVADFHSHTNVSHDVRSTAMRGYDVAANLRWHRRAGFDAAFITDHNTIAPPGPAKEGGTARCPGIEVSAWRAHVVLLGDSLPVDRSRYSRNLEGLLTLLRDSDSAYGALSVASLPEYRRHQWGRLDTLIAAGLDGLELVNAAPQANQFTRAERDTVVALARKSGRFLLGVSDHHGWGATSMVWNLVSIPGGRDSGEICAAILDRLRDGFSANRIVERHRLRPDSPWPEWLTPVGVLWETWRSMGWALTASWVIWIWAGWRVRRQW